MTKTIKLRIALCVDSRGEWVQSRFDDFDYMCSTLGPVTARYWVEVEVPVPDAEPPTVQGKATEVQP